MRENNRKRIGVDFHVVNGKYQGSRTYLLELLSRIIVLCPDIDFYFFLEDTKVLFTISDAFKEKNVFLIKMPAKNPFFRLLFQLPYYQKKYDLALLHTQYIIPPLSYKNCIVTIHDILFETHPQYFTRSFILRSKILVRWAAVRSKHVFTVSRYSKEQIKNTYGIPADKITLTYNGVSPRYFPGENGCHYLTRRNLKPKSYLLCVGRLEPRKNYPALLESYSRIKNKNYPLVIAGQKDFGFEKIFLQIDQLALRGKVIFIEDADDMELASLYRNTLLFIYPSHAEGFGMPVAEAMASGVPVITSANTSLHEIAGSAAITIDPSNVQELTDVMNDLINSREKRERCVADGLSHVNQFNWDLSAGIMAQKYRSIVHND
jgi:glycosyltransferase involved in cell wall biosynthesis